MKKVTLVKSTIGALPNQKATAKSLGLNKIGDFIMTTPFLPARCGSSPILLR